METLKRPRAWLTSQLATGAQATALDLWIVASTIWGEARSEPLEGQQAVAWVILNRQQRHPRWQGKTLAAVCQAPWQFSAWNKNDPNYPKLLALTLTTPGFATCLHTTIDVLSGNVPSPVGKSTHYFATALDHQPAWALGKTPFIIIARHAFYQGIA